MSNLEKEQFAQEGQTPAQINDSDLDAFKKEYENLNNKPSNSDRVIIFTNDEED